MKINELIWQAAREYARQFGELLGVGPPTIGELSRLKPAYFSIYLHI